MSVQETAVDLRQASSDEGWRRRISHDRDAIERCLPSELAEVHEAVVGRARNAGARGLVLSGSTARSRRTEISDLDYHLVGPQIVTRDLPLELDLHVLSEVKLEATILSGDDFVQWSLRFGLVVFDDDVLRRAVRLIAERQPWPDVDRKLRHAAQSIDLARRFVATGDEDGALVQVRTALSLAARARLLSASTFPMSRAELPAQLAAIGFKDAGDALAATIYDAVPLEALAEAVRHGEELLAVSRTPP